MTTTKKTNGELSVVRQPQSAVIQKTLETNNRKEIKTGSQVSEDRNSGRKSATPQRQTR